MECGSLLPEIAKDPYRPLVLIVMIAKKNHIAA